MKRSRMGQAAVLGVAVAFAAAAFAEKGSETPERKAGQKNEPSPVVAFVIPAGRPDAAECRKLVKTVNDVGFDQLLVYPSTGLEYEYLSEDFFGMVGAFFDEMERRGMKAWLYDEFNWPSGTARGRVPAENEKCLYRELVAATNAAGAVVWDTVVSREINIDNYCLDTNNFEPESVKRFMELTHRQYERHFAKYMGSLIRGIFSDEPGHCTSARAMKMPQGCILRLPYWSGMEEEYRLASGGRDFRADVETAFRAGNLGKSDVLRLWTDLRSRRYLKTYFDPIADWCRSVGIESTGHLVGEDYAPFCACINGSPLHTVKGFTKPGIDLIKSITNKNFEWITLAFGQSAAMANGKCGMAELFALGPCDLTFTIMRKLYWICALHKIDTYYQSLYHHKGYRFNIKDGYAMFSSPTQPWFKEMPLLHETAKEAARWAAKPFVCEIAVVYPQRTIGAAAAAWQTADRPKLEELCRELTWNQFTYRLVEEDEKTDLPVVLDWDGSTLVERGTKTRFADSAAALRWLEARFPKRPRVVDAAGRTRPGFITRAYQDGSAVAVDATSGEVIVARDGRLAPSVSAPKGRPLVAAGEKVPLSLSGPSCRRVWFAAKDGCSRVKLTEPLKGVRFALCRHPSDRKLSVSLDGRALVFPKPCTSVAYAFDDLYRETEPMDLAAGEHVFELKGGTDGKLFLPALWMIGEFAEHETNVLSSKENAVSLGSLASVGLGSFAGTATYRLEAAFAAGERLQVDSGEAVIRVRFGGRDLGAKGWAPFAWEIPADLVGRKLPLEIDVITSVRPIFGSEKHPDAKLDHSLWTPPSLHDISPVGLRAVEAVASDEIVRSVAADLENEIRPGGVAQPGFWNENATRFMYPTSLRFMDVPGAAKYRFSVVDPRGKLVTLESQDPVIRLKPHWADLACGIVNVVCEALDAKGARVGLVQDRFFYKKAPFTGVCPPPARSAGEAAKAAFAYLLAMPQVRHLAEKGEPDRSYGLNGYTTKMNAAIIQAMVRYAKLEPAKAPETLKIARAAADHLIKGAAKPGTPLAGFTETYEAGYGNWTCNKYAGQSMNLYPSYAGNAFLKLYGATGDGKYLAAAVRIGETYVRLQGEDGTWFLKQRFEDGKEVNPNRLFPLTTMEFLEGLYAETKRAEFRAAADRAFAFIEKGPVVDWNWEGQFEDVEPEPLYSNLTKHPATDFAMFCLKRFPGDKKRLALARAILRFAEDQFVEWERPFQGYHLPPPAWGLYARDFWREAKAPYEEAVYPAVLEQYRCYVPVDASSAKMIRTYLALYRAEGKELDRSKAQALGDALTRAQRADGSIPTWMIPSGPYKNDWINCLIASASALEELSACK